MASCFTRISYSPKLWITSLLDRCTSTGRSIGQVQLVDRRDVVLRVRIGAIETERVVGRDQLDVGPPEPAVGAGIVDVPRELLGDDAHDDRFALGRELARRASPRPESRRRRAGRPR